MGDSTHTELPLKVGGYEETVNAYIFEIPLSNGKINVSCPSYEESQSTAELIVKAVNNHELLVEALKQILKISGNSESAGISIFKMEAIALEALSKLGYPVALASSSPTVPNAAGAALPE